MDWIERFIGINPDGGDGTAEAAVVFVCVIVVAAAMVMRAPSLRQRLRTMFLARRTR